MSMRNPAQVHLQLPHDLRARAMKASKRVHPGLSLSSWARDVLLKAVELSEQQEQPEKAA